MESYIESPELVEVNRLPPRAYYIPDSACSLNGQWEFALKQSVTEALVFVEENSYLAQGLENKAKITVPGHWQLQGFGNPNYCNFKYPFPINPPFVMSKNPTGVYRREFGVEDVELAYRLRFDGVDSACYVFLNGKFVGFSKGSRNPAEYDVTGQVKSSGNVLVVIVAQWSDGSYLEDQDQWWMSGIFRDVNLIGHSKQGNVEDFDIRTQALHNDNARVSVECKVNHSGPVKLRIETKAPCGSHWTEQKVCNISDDEKSSTVSTELEFTDPALWSAEEPNLYAIRFTLASDGEELDAVETPFGIKTVEISKSRLLVNGRPIKIKGVNRHDNHATKGRAVSSEDVKADLLLMKQYNINSIRCSHYPSHPSLFRWADVLGLYVIDETDLETHGFDIAPIRQGSQDTLGDPHPDRLDPRFYKEGKDFASDNILWQAAYLDRVKQMVYRDRNHPSIIMWSLGNEAQFGQNHVAMAKWVKEFYPQLPVHYERDQSTEVADVYSVMYPTHDFVEYQGQLEDDKPFMMCEYAHAMGNGPGALDEYQELIYKYDRCIGGLIWEWANHGILTKAGEEEYYAYGGDFDEEIHDGTFVMDGLCDSEHKPTPGLVQLKKTFQPAKFSFRVVEDTLVAECDSLNTFVGLEPYKLRLNIDRLSAGTTAVAFEASPEYEVSHGSISAKVKIPRVAIEEEDIVIATASLHLAEDTAWEKSGYEVAFDQFDLTKEFVKAKNDKTLQPVACSKDNKLVVELQAGDFTIVLSKVTGEITSVKKEERELLIQGPKLAFWRAPTDNDRGLEGYGITRSWIDHYVNYLHESLDSVEVASEGDATRVTVSLWIAPVVVQWGFKAVLEYVFSLSNGQLNIATTVNLTPKGGYPSSIPRIGLDMILKKYSDVEWIGRGPGESYPDSKSACRFGQFKLPAEALFTSYDVPQDNGNRSDVYSVTLLNGSVPFLSAKYDDSLLNFQAQPYTPLELEKAGHPYELKQFKVQSHFSVNFAVQGLGTGSCGPGPLEKYILEPKQGTYKVTYVFH
ncbi:hypothetical protein TRVA0_006S02102 [Trichomonascus vanleenenianus]|uniref:uncharacterized protein n=1 Tax=Trichomonascus vanleenenianus TaxID=2268995 RepID=UPI003ECA07F1